MNKRKLTIIALCLLAGLALGGTSAYYVSEKHTHNIITTSGVDISILEADVDVEGLLPFEGITDAKSGESYAKVPIVKNNAGDSAWARVCVRESATLSDGSTSLVEGGIFSFNIDDANWLSLGDGCYYYRQALLAGEMTEPLFTKVSVKEDLPNKYNGATFSLSLVAGAVQTVGNGTSVETAEGWPEE